MPEKVYKFTHKKSKHTVKPEKEIEIDPELWKVKPDPKAFQVDVNYKAFEVEIDPGLWIDAEKKKKK